MKTFLLSLISTLLLSATAFGSNGKTLLQFEGNLDLSNLFISSKKISYRNYRIPENIAHTYTVKTIVSVPKDMKAQVVSKTVHTGSHGGPRGGYRNGGSSQHNELKFTHPDLKVTWELYDDKSGKLIARKSEGLYVYFFNTLSTPVFAEKLTGSVGLVNNGSHRDQDIIFHIPSESPATLIISKTVSLAPLNSHVVNLAPASKDEYIFSSIKFDLKRISKSFNSLVKLDLNNFEHGHYFGVGSENSERPGYYTDLLSIDEE